MKLARTLLALFGALVLLPVAAQAGLVTNGGFETGDFTGWVQSGNLGYTSVSTSAHSGSYGAWFGPVGSYGYISQVLPTTAGWLYDLSFWGTADAGYPTQVWWNGVLVYNLAGAPGNWTLLTVEDLAATGSSTELKLGFRNDPSYTGVDDIDVVPSSAIPEPSTMILAALGLAALAWRRR